MNFKEIFRKQKCPICNVKLKNLKKTYQTNIKHCSQCKLTLLSSRYDYREYQFIKIINNDIKIIWLELGAQERAMIKSINKKPSMHINLDFIPPLNITPNKIKTIITFQ